MDQNSATDVAMLHGLVKQVNCYVSEQVDRCVLEQVESLCFRPGNARVAAREHDRTALGKSTGPAHAAWPRQRKAEPVPARWLFAVPRGLLKNYADCLETASANPCIAPAR